MQRRRRLQIKRDHRGRDATPDADEGSDSNSELSPLKKLRYRDAVAVAHLLLGRVRALIAIYVDTSGAGSGNQIMFPLLTMAVVRIVKYGA